MSKEQTPIEEIVDRYTEGNYLIGKTAKSEMVKELENVVNAKVLEALEGHIVGFVTHSANEDLSEDYKGYNEFVNLVKNYIETEVKPKYKL